MQLLGHFKVTAIVLNHVASVRGQIDALTNIAEIHKAFKTKYFENVHNSNDPPLLIWGPHLHSLDYKFNSLLLDQLKIFKFPDFEVYELWLGVLANCDWL